MNNLSVPSKCVCFRNGVEIWIPEGEKLDKFQSLLSNLSNHMFVGWEGRNMNTADIVGIFMPEDIEDMKRRKNGQWKCQKGSWHDKFQECSCKVVEDTSPYANEPEITDEERAANIKAIDQLRGKIKPLKSFPKPV